MATFKLQIVTPEKTAFSDDAERVLINGVEGQMTILPMHAPLFTQLAPGPIEIQHRGKIEELVIGNGYAEITQTAVKILTDLAASEEEIDEGDVEDAIKRARTAMKDSTLPADEIEDMEALIRRSIAELSFKRRRKSRH
jgi:F-type H+-transporting ATPase subunit epsilon